MKRFLPLFLILLCFSAHATDVLISLQDSRILAAPYTNRTIYIDPYSTPTVNSPSVVMGNRIIGMTDTNGNFLVQSNFPGLYQVTVTAPPMLERFKYLVTSTGLGQINAADNLVADAGATFPGGSVAWAAAVSDGRYSRGTNAPVSFQQVTNALGYTPAPSGSYQPAATGLTNWNNVATNLVAYLTQLGTAAFSNTAAFYLNNNPSNYVTATVTNGLQSASVIGTAAYSNATSFYLNANPSNYVTASVTNGLQSASVIGTAAYSNATAFTIQNNVTNIINGQFVGGAQNVVTNGPGITVQPSTNGISFINNLANISSGGLWGGQGANFVGTVFAGLFFGPIAGTLTNNTTGNSTLSTNALNVATAVTNQWRTDATNTVNALTNDPSIIRASVIGTAAYSNATAFYLNNNPSNYVTASVTNGLVTYNSLVTNANGVNITNLNASNLASGTVPLAQLSGITSNQLAVSTIGTNQFSASAVAWINSLIANGSATNAIATSFGKGTNTTLYNAVITNSPVLYSPTIADAELFGSGGPGLGDNSGLLDLSGYQNSFTAGSSFDMQIMAASGQSYMTPNSPNTVMIASVASKINTSSTAAILSGNRSTNSGNHAVLLGGHISNTNNGTFMFGDSSSNQKFSPADNTFNVWANGGVKLNTSGAGLTVDGSPVQTVAGSMVTNDTRALFLTNNANIFSGIVTGYLVGTVSGTLTNNTIGNAAGATNVYGTVNGTQLVGGTITNNINSPSVASGNFSGTASALTVTNVTVVGPATMTNPNNVFVGNGNGLTNNLVLSVRTNGNDATGAPYATIEGACGVIKFGCTNLVSGCIVDIGPGTFWISNSIYLPTNLFNITFRSTASTKVLSYVNNDALNTIQATIIPNNGFVLDGNGGRWGIAPGQNQGLAMVEVIGTNGAAGSTPITNVVVRNVVAMAGATDWFYDNGTQSGSSISFYSDTFSGGWDTMVLGSGQATGGCTYIVDGCTFYYNDVLFVTGNNTGIARGIAFTPSDGGGVVPNLYTYFNTNSCTIRNCNITLVTTNGIARGIDFQVRSGGSGNTNQYGGNLFITSTTISVSGGVTNYPIEIHNASYSHINIPGLGHCSGSFVGNGTNYIYNYTGTIYQDQNGSAQSTIVATNIVMTQSAYIFSNAPSAWPATPISTNDACIVMSNGWPYMLLTTNCPSGSKVWTGTNKLGW